MKRFLIFAFVLTLFLGFLNSCGEDETAKLENMEQQLLHEKDQKREAQKAKDQAVQDASKSKSLSNLLIGLSIAGALVAFGGGLALGSKAKKDFANQNRAEGNDHE